MISARAKRTAAGITRRDFGQAALWGWMCGATAPEAHLNRNPQAPMLASAAAVLTTTPRSDIKRWRADFPVLDQRVNGYPLTYLDSAATTQRPKAVVETILEFYRNDNANPGAELHALARRAYERYERARRTVAGFIKAGQAEEVVWVRGSTEGINLVASAWARPRLRPGDEVLLSNAEHASNMLPWQLVAEQTGVTVRYVDVDDEGRILLDDLDRKLSQKTRIAAFSHVSNVAGFINPVSEICARARTAGARVLVDAAQSAPHIPIDVRELGCDFLVLSGHKMLGPMGVGALWARHELLEEMLPYQAGSNMAHEVEVASRMFEHGAHKFGAGTPNVSGAIGLAAAVDYLNALDRVAIERHEAYLTQYALAQLAEVPGVRLLGPRDPDKRVPVFSFVVTGHSPREILQHLDAGGIAVRAGDLSALPLLRRFGVDAAVRASCYLYTQTSDIDRLCGALHELTRMRAEGSRRSRRRC
jgi:cysteine desulfurase / selenocysteine lyase